MKERTRNTIIFLTALGSSFAGLVPRASCSGVCCNCFQCAGYGGVAAILAAIGLAKKRKPRREASDRFDRQSGMKTDE